MMNVRSTAVLFAATALLLAGCDQKPKQVAQSPAPAAGPVQPAAAPTTAHNHLIREGVGVGGVELGMTPDEVVRAVGRAPERTNKAGDTVVFMSFHEKEIFGIYFGDDGGAPRVRMIIAAMQDKTWCTDFDVCLYREHDLTKLKAHHGAKLLRFVDRDSSVYYRLPGELNGKKVMTIYTPVEEQRDGVVQVEVSYWNGPNDMSTFD